MSRVAGRRVAVLYGSCRPEAVVRERPVGGTLECLQPRQDEAERQCPTNQLAGDDVFTSADLRR